MSYRKFSLMLLLVFAALGLGAQNLSREQYINKYKDIAIQQMHKSQIPASIILAQACLESSDGNSALARKANNHFGIKCHDGWRGKKFKQDDDERNECFRKYEKAMDSFTDHSNFLRSRTRYASLFDLPITDYKAWAHGLKAAGYATNPRYAEQLITIIEAYELYRFDSAKAPESSFRQTYAQKKEAKLLERKNRLERKAEKAAKKAQKASDKYYKHIGTVPPPASNVPQGAVQQPQGQKPQSHQTSAQQKHDQPAKGNQGQPAGNNTGFYQVKQGDTLYSIAKKHGITVNDLLKLNPGVKADSLKIGSRLKLK